MEFDTFNLMQRLRREITFTAVRAYHDGHILNDQQICALAVTPGRVPNLCAAFAANVANESFDFHVIRHRQ